MTSLLNLIRQIARDEISKHPVLEIGIVDSIVTKAAADDAHDFECAVRFPGRKTPDDEPLKVENVKVATQHTGLVNPPYIDDMVLVSFINRNFDEPVIIGKLYTKEKPAPIFKQGQYILEFKPEVFQYNDEDADGAWGLGEWETTKDQAEVDAYQKFHIRFYLNEADTSEDGKDSEVYGAELIMDRDRITMKVDQDAASEIILERSGGSRLSITQEGDISMTAERNIQLYAPDTIQLIAGTKLTGNADEIAFTASDNFGATAGTQANMQSKDVNILASDNINLSGYDPGKSSDDDSAFSAIVDAFSSFKSDSEDTSKARASGNSQGSGFADLLADAVDKGADIISKLMGAGKDDAEVKNVNVLCTSWKAEVNASGPCGIGIFGGTAKWLCDKDFVVKTDKNINLTAKKAYKLTTKKKGITITAKKKDISITAKKGDSSWDTTKGKLDISAKKAISIQSKNDAIKNKAKKTFEVKATKDIKMKSDSNIKAQATKKIDLQAKMDLKMKAMNIKGKADMNAELKGTMGKFDASGILTLKGGLVKIN